MTTIEDELNMRADRLFDEDLAKTADEFGMAMFDLIRLSYRTIDDLCRSPEVVALTDAARIRHRETYIRKFVNDVEKLRGLL
jgi:hypothetical protein